MEELRWWFPAGTVVEDSQGGYRWERVTLYADDQRMMLDSGPLELLNGVGYVRSVDLSIPVEADRTDDGEGSLPAFPFVHYYFDADMADVGETSPWLCNCGHEVADEPTLRKTCRYPSLDDDLRPIFSENTVFPTELWEALGMSWITSEYPNGLNTQSADREYAHGGQVVTLVRTLAPGLQAKATLDARGRTQPILSLLPFWCPTSMGGRRVTPVPTTRPATALRDSVYFDLGELQFLFVGPVEKAVLPQGSRVSASIGGILLTAQPSQRRDVDLFALVDQNKREPLGHYHFVAVVCQVVAIAGTHRWWYVVDLQLEGDGQTPVRCVLSPDRWKEPFPPFVGRMLEGEVQFVGTLNDA